MGIEAAKTAAMRYSKEYFVGEIFNNLAGILNDGDSRKMAAFRDAVRTVPTRQFRFDDVQSELDGELDAHMTKRLLKQMFEVGGMGIVNKSGSGGQYTDFVFRNVTGAGFSTKHDFVLHNALTMAWNRPWR